VFACAGALEHVQGMHEYAANRAAVAAFKSHLKRDHLRAGANAQPCCVLREGIVAKVACWALHHVTHHLHHLNMPLRVMDGAWLGSGLRRHGESGGALSHVPLAVNPALEVALLAARRSSQIPGGLRKQSEEVEKQKRGRRGRSLVGAEPHMVDFVLGHTVQG
jgi:hypothetical protein